MLVGMALLWVGIMKVPDIHGVACAGCGGSAGAPFRGALLHNSRPIYLPHKALQRKSQRSQGKTKETSLMARL